MPFRKLAIRPGIDTQQTQTLNSAGLSQSNLVRFKNGLIEKIGGWLSIFANPAGSIVRSMHAYQDLYLNKILLMGTDAGPKVYSNGLGPTSFTFTRLTSMSPTTTVTPSGIGSTLLTVHDAANGALAGDIITFVNAIPVGGRIIPANSSFTIVTRIDANNYTFNMALAATTTTAAALVTYTLTTGPDLGPNQAPAPVPWKVNLTAHGLVAGNSYKVQSTIICSPPFFSLAAGTYTVASVIDANNFYLNRLDTGVANTVETGTEGNGNIVILYGGHAPPTFVPWFVDNFGQVGLLSYAGGPIIAFTPPAPLVGNAAAQVITSGPQACSGMFMAMPQRQVIVFGSDMPLGSGVIDPLLVRFSDVGDYSVWTASSTNQAGSFPLSRGSAIIGGMQAPQTTLLWTDIDIWSMQYIGPPLVYSFNIIGAGCGLIAPNARASLGRNTYWMSIESFFVYGDSGVQPIECPVWDVVFPNIDRSNASKIFCVANSPFQEIVFYYPSISGGTGECDSYVKMNVMQNTWDYGSLDRTAGINESLFGTTLYADLQGVIQQHDVGYDNGTSPMKGAFVETGFADLSDGDDIPVIDMMIPDFKWLGSGGSVNVTFWGTNYPGESPEMYGPFTITPTTKYVDVRVRKRQIALRVDWGHQIGFSARIGAIRLRVAASGKRP